MIDSGATLSGSPNYLEQYYGFLAERPFGLHQLACACAVLRANAIPPNDLGLYDIPLYGEQWANLKADRSFRLVFGEIRAYCDVRGAIDVIPVGVTLHVGDKPEPHVPFVGKPNEPIEHLPHECPKE